MIRFLKKPVEIEAIRWDGKNFAEIFEWAHKGLPKEFNAWIRRPWGSEDGMEVRTANNTSLTARQGDWITKDANGEIKLLSDLGLKLNYDPFEPVDVSAEKTHPLLESARAISDSIQTAARMTRFIGHGKKDCPICNGLGMKEISIGNPLGKVCDCLPGERL